jgi:hypothetical protein
MLHLSSFFLRLHISCFSEQNRILLWTSESFGEVASQSKIEFQSGLRRAWEGLLLGTKLHSALGFVELLRGRFLEQNRVPLWNLGSICQKMQTKHPVLGQKDIIKQVRCYGS